MRQPTTTGRLLLALLLLVASGAVAGAAIQVTDQRGRTLAFDQPVQRLGTPGISLASLILLLGGPSSLMAVAPEVLDNPWLQRLWPELSDLPTPFSRPAGVNPESLLQLRPELVALWHNHTPLGRRLESLGIPVVYFNYGTPAELQQAALLLGRLLGDAAYARAEAFVADYQRQLDRVAAALADLPAAGRPGVYYASIGLLHTEGSDSMVDAWVRLAGGRNLAAAAGLQRDVRIHLEDLLAWNPDIIITQTAALQQSLLADGRLQGIKAVREGRVIANPASINAWCTRAAEAALQVPWAAQVFHPERFAGLDLAAETRRFHQDYYGLQLTDEEVARILRGQPPQRIPLAGPEARTP